MAKFGIDVSLWQKGFDFEQAKAEGAEFVIIKCSQKNYKDPQFENHYKAAKAVGLDVGAYHYLEANTVAEAVKEAEVCLRAIKGKKFEYPIYLDFEENIYTKNTKQKNGEIIKAFCEAVEKAGYWVGVYTGYNFYKNYLDGAAIANRYTLWLASWTKKKPFSVPMWQFGGETNKIRTNKVAGVLCDQNYCYVDFPTQIKQRGLNGFSAKKTTAAEAKKPATQSTKTAAIKKGDKVKVIKNIIYGTNKEFTVYFDKYDVIQVNGKRVVIGIGKVATAAVSADNLKKV